MQHQRSCYRFCSRSYLYRDRQAEHRLGRRQNVPLVRTSAIIFTTADHSTDTEVTQSSLALVKQQDPTGLRTIGMASLSHQLLLTHHIHSGVNWTAAI